MLVELLPYFAVMVVVNVIALFAAMLIVAVTVFFGVVYAIKSLPTRGGSSYLVKSSNGSGGIQA